MKLSVVCHDNSIGTETDLYTIAGFDLYIYWDIYKAFSMILYSSANNYI